MTVRKWLIIIITILSALFFSIGAYSADGDAIIDFNLGLAAELKGEVDEACERYKKACMASDGFVDPCMAWARLAEKKGNEQDVKRALSSAVMFDPLDIEARYALAGLLLKNKDYTWAIEHLQAALESSTEKDNTSLLQYYLGYALLKNKERRQAYKLLSIACPELKGDLAQRCNYYLALAGTGIEHQIGTISSLEKAIEGPDPAWSRAAENRLERLTLFPKQNGFSGQAIGSIGINTHPASAFLDDLETDSLPVLQSVFRADAIFAAGGYAHGLRASLTGYREQNWTKLGGDSETDPSNTASKNSDESFTPQDFNVTMFLPQAAYVHRSWLKGIEQELQLGLEGETQFLDNMPQKKGTEMKPTGFGINTWSVGTKAWWSLAPSANTVLSARFKFEIRPNNIDENRSSTRYRLQILGTRYVFNRKLRLNVEVVGRYDRAYVDPEIYKYDRLIPELTLGLKWKTPIPRLTITLESEFKYNWYINSRGNEANSFRPKWEDVENISDELNALYKEGYYAETRQDVEWDLNGEVLIALWKMATLAVTYKHHQRESNLDSAPRPKIKRTNLRVEAPIFGYKQDIVMLELRQGF